MGTLIPIPAQKVFGNVPPQGGIHTKFLVSDVIAAGARQRKAVVSPGAGSVLEQKIFQGKTIPQPGIGDPCHDRH
jgi:hypothetical protein